VACQGTGVAGPDTCAVSPATLDFGSVTVGQVLDRTFTVTNTGTRRLVGNLSESCADFAIEGLTGYDLAPGQSQTLTIRFLPNQTGPRSCTITASGCPAISCTGTGVPVDPACSVSKNGLLFPQQALGTRSDATFELLNAGTSNLAGTVTESCPGFSIPGQASYDLAPGERQTFIVRFEPIYVGDHTCEVNLGAGCPPLSCWGSGVIGCSYQPERIHFGYFRPGEIRCGSLTLTNNSSTLQTGNLRAQQIGWDTGTILLDGVTISGAGSSLPYSLNAGQSRTFTLCWRAELIAGQPTRCDTTLGEWRIRSSDEGCTDVYATIQGIITRGCECSISPTVLDFGSIVVGDESTGQTVGITNQSRINGLRGQIRVLSGDFEVSRTDYECRCSDSFIGCDGFEVRFKPTQLGLQTGKIVIDNLVGCLGPGAGSACDTVTVTGVGTTAGEKDRGK
jgi:Transmembrane protein 131-like N-terminal